MAIHAGFGCHKVLVRGPSDTAILALGMQGTASSQFSAAGAGGVLLAVLAAGIGIGVLIGWAAAGSGAVGALVGAVFGIFGGIVAVYLRYGS